MLWKWLAIVLTSLFFEQIIFAMETKYPEVDRISEEDPAQSTSE